MKERLLAAALLLPCLAAVGLERASPVSSALRQGTPIEAWVSALDGSGQRRRYWSLYQPRTGTLDLVYMQGPKAVPPNLAAHALPALELARPLPADLDPALALKDAILARFREVGFWAAFPAVARASPLPAFDTLALALELRRIAPDRVRPAWLPEPSARALFWDFLLSAAPRPAPGRPPAVEVLNASVQKGIALNATKFLRSKGIDVVYFGNSAVHPRSVVFDRAGNAATARMILDALGCRQAAIVTQLQAEKMLDATVLLAADCAAAFTEKK